MESYIFIYRSGSLEIWFRFSFYSSMCSISIGWIWNNNPIGRNALLCIIIIHGVQCAWKEFSFLLLFVNSSVAICFLLTFRAISHFECTIFRLILCFQMCLKKGPTECFIVTRLKLMHAWFVLNRPRLNKWKCHPPFTSHCKFTAYQSH